MPNTLHEPPYTVHIADGPDRIWTQEDIVKEILRNSKLMRVSIDVRNINGNKLSQVFGALGERDIKSLSLYHNGIGDGDVEQIIEFMRQHPDLENLMIQNSKITSKGANEIIRESQNNPKLWSLNLMESQIDDSISLEHISSGVKNLGLQGNDLTVAPKGLRQAILKGSLRDINLGQNEISKEGIKPLHGIYEELEKITRQELAPLQKFNDNLAIHIYGNCLSSSQEAKDLSISKIGKENMSSDQIEYFKSLDVEKIEEISTQIQQSVRLGTLQLERIKEKSPDELIDIVSNQGRYPGPMPDFQVGGSIDVRCGRASSEEILNDMLDNPIFPDEEKEEKLKKHQSPFPDYKKGVDTDITRICSKSNLVEIDGKEIQDGNLEHILEIHPKDLKEGHSLELVLESLAEKFIHETADRHDRSGFMNKKSKGNSYFSLISIDTVIFKPEIGDKGKFIQEAKLEDRHLKVITDFFEKIGKASYDSGHDFAVTLPGDKSKYDSKALDSLKKAISTHKSRNVDDIEIEYGSSYLDTISNIGLYKGPHLKNPDSCETRFVPTASVIKAEISGVAPTPRHIEL